MEQVKEVLSLSSPSPSSSSSSSSSAVVAVVEEARRELEWRDFFRFTTAKYSERALGGAEKKGASKEKAENCEVVVGALPKQQQRQQQRQRATGLFRGERIERLWAALSLASGSGAGSSHAAASAAAAYV
jgi:hypothetical protein